MMNKNDFIAELRKELNGLPDSDIQRSIDFYTEMIEDKIEDVYKRQVPSIVKSPTSMGTGISLTV